MKKMIWALALASSTVSAGDDLYYLAEAIYFEARSEILACQIIVAQSIMNRVDQDRFPDTIKEVIHQTGWSKKYNKEVCQYSYTCDGKSNKMTNIKSEIRSYQVASMVLLGEVPDLSEGADHYYAHDIATPSWDSSLEDRYVCDNHTFGKVKW